MSASEVPVIMITGFLDAGKTTFLQNIMENKDFNDGEKMLLIVCEEGEAEYDRSRFASDAVTVLNIEDEDDLNPEDLEKARKKCGATRVVVEYNGMWMISSFVSAMPEAWVIYQEITLADSKTYVAYNANMRNLVVDKLQNCDMITFTRITDDTDVMPLHQIVRTVGRGIRILYDFGGGRKEEDAIEDPLPFDIDAKVIEIGDRFYGVWYADMMENLHKYHKKTVKFLAYIGKEDKMPSNSFFAGRHVMTCCANDIQFAGLLCYWDRASVLSTGDWAILTADISVERNKIYRGKGPVLRITSMVRSSAPDEPVVTFAG